VIPVIIIIIIIIIIIKHSSCFHGCAFQ